MQNTINLGFLLFVCLKLTAQQPNRVLLGNDNFSTEKYTIYTPKKTIKAKYKNIVEVRNLSIEDLMASILSADTQEWVNFNTLGGHKNAHKKSEEDFEKIRKRDNRRTFFELTSKLDIQKGLESFSIVRFKFYLEQAPNGVSGAYILQKVGDRWFKTSRSDLSELTLMLIFFKPEVFSDIINGKMTGEKLTDELIDKTYGKDGLNINKLYQEFSLWERDKVKSEYFLEPAGW